jgi:hypothetical protein
MGSFIIDVVQWHYGTTMENYEQSITAVWVVIYRMLYCNMRIETTLYFRLIAELFPSRPHI